MTHNASVSYTWAFQRTNQPLETRQFVNNIARIYSITRALPPYIHPDCPTPCPGRTRASRAGRPARATRSTAGATATAECKDNVTDLSLYESEGGKPEGGASVRAFVCQSTIIPAGGRGFHTSLSSQSITLVDTFLGATVETTLGDITARPDLFPDAKHQLPNIIIYYRSSDVTASCMAGRSLVLLLRCDPDMSPQGDVTVPSPCPAGTCDGCSFHFLWRSSGACPLCSHHDSHRIEGACKHGLQGVVWVWKEPRVCVGKQTLPCDSVEGNTLHYGPVSPWYLQWYF
uniref:MRH domain-containing protein n=1 Tax=Knipowitschia caucasica TaxID=637954 RepID=A0AAV2JE21_KNICA